MVVEFFDMDLSERIKSRAYELGFDLVGIAPAGLAPHAKEYADWIAAGYAGEMAYMTRDPDRRSDLRRVLPGAQSVIVVGLSYYTLDLPDEVKNDPSRGLIARYAWGVDYHDLMTPRLKELAEFVSGVIALASAKSPRLRQGRRRKHRRSVCGYRPSAGTRLGLIGGIGLHRQEYVPDQSADGIVVVFGGDYYGRCPHPQPLPQPWERGGAKRRVRE